MAKVCGVIMNHGCSWFFYFRSGPDLIATAPEPSRGIDLKNILFRRMMIVLYFFHDIRTCLHSGYHFIWKMIIAWWCYITHQEAILKLFRMFYLFKYYWHLYSHDYNTNSLYKNVSKNYSFNSSNLASIK